MSLETYEPDDAPKMSVRGRTVALVKVRYYREYPQTRHSPKEDAYIEVEKVMILNEETDEWEDAPEGLVLEINEDIDLGQEAWDAFVSSARLFDDYDIEPPDPYYEF